jgi:hypothetical protein
VVAEVVLRAPGRELHVVGTVRGLVAEGARVAAAFDAIAPETVALGVGPEDLEGLQRFLDGEPYEHEFSESDEVYAHFLGQFGPVALPPRDLIEAARLAKARSVPVVAIDLPEVAYVDAFTRAVSGWDLLRYNRRVRRLAKRPPVADTALEFHLAWDHAVGRLRGFAALERTREAHMARQLREASGLNGRVLVLLEAARIAGVVENFRGPDPTFIQRSQ